MNVQVTVLLFAPSLLLACAAEPDKPDIVEIFACSDLCPNPVESYMRQVYDGVTEEDECDRLGGSFFYVTGWGTQTFCGVVDENQQKNTTSE